MKKRSTKIDLQIRENKVKLSKLLDVEERTDEQETEKRNLQKKIQTLEEDYLIAVKLEEEETRKSEKNFGDMPGVDPEEKERRELRGKVSVSRMLSNAIRGNRFNGPEEEYRQMTKTEERAIPLDVFEVEKRADAGTGAPDVVGINMQPVVPNIFSKSIANDLLIEMPGAGSGQFSVPRMANDLSAGMKAKGIKQDSTSATFSVVSSKPKRLTGRLSLTIEDLAEVGIAFENSLKQNLQMVMSDALDTQILSGDNAKPNLNGLMPQLTEDSEPTGIIDFASFVESLAGQVDGLFSATIGDLKLFVNPSVYQKLASLFQVPVDPSKGGGRSILTAADWASEKLTGFKAHNRLPASASNVGKCLVCMTGSMNADPMPMAGACVPVWSSGVSISDPYSDAGSGLHHFTTSMLIGDVLVKHPGVYAELKIKTA